MLKGMLRELALYCRHTKIQSIVLLQVSHIFRMYSMVTKRMVSDSGNVPQSILKHILTISRAAISPKGNSMTFWDRPNAVRSKFMFEQPSFDCEQYFMMQGTVLT